MSENPILAKAIGMQVVYAAWGARQVVEGVTLLNPTEAVYRACGFADLPPVELGENQHAEYSVAVRTVRRQVEVGRVWEGGKPEPTVIYEERDVEEQYIVGKAVDTPEAIRTQEEYNQALEDYLLEVRTLRGYTDREPTDYATSGVARWAQDAVDWADFRDRVMLYGLEVLNQYEAEGEPPCTLDEFKAHLRTIECNWTCEVAQ